MPSPNQQFQRQSEVRAMSQFDPCCVWQLVKEARVRRMLAASILVFATTIFSGGGTHAGQQDSLLALYGATGMVSCRHFTTANGARRATYEWWLLGFVSGAGYVRSNMGLPMAVTDAHAATERAADYCREKPLDTLAAAATAVVRELGS